MTLQKLVARNIRNNIKGQQVNLRDHPGKVAVNCRDIKYHSYSHKNNSKNEAGLSPPTHRVRRSHVVSTKQVCCN